MKPVLCLSLCLLFGACAGANPDAGTEPEEAWSGNPDPKGVYAAEVERFDQNCQDGSSQSAWGSGAEMHVDVVPEASAPLRLYTVQATLIYGNRTYVYAFGGSGVDDQGRFKVWKNDVGEHGGIYVELSGTFEESAHGAVRVTGQLMQNTLEYPVPGHLCSNIYRFGPS